MLKDSQAENVTMSGGGLYSLATIGAKDVIDRSIPRVLNAVSDLPALVQGHWCFSDMGCADGGTSLQLWSRVIDALPSSRDIQIVYADQVRNDFNALAAIVHGNTDFDAYLPKSPHVRVLQSAASFYTPIVPANSLHVGYSATAMHWLSRKPCDIVGHVHMVGASGEAFRAFQQQAQSDWQAILLHRARELVSGGKLVLVNFCRDEEGRYLGNTTGVNMFDLMNTIWQSFADDGVITEAEYLGMTLPQYYNTIDELCAPFKDERSAVWQAGLRLLDVETAVVSCPFARDFLRHRDAARFAREYVPTIRSWNESTYYGALADTRSTSERQDIIDAFYTRYAEEVEANAAAHRMDYVHAYMTIEKR